MYFLFKMGIFQPAMFVYRRVLGGFKPIWKVYMDVSENSGFSSQIIHFNRVFHYKPSIFWGTTIFGNTHIQVKFDHLSSPGRSEIFQKIFETTSAMKWISFSCLLNISCVTTSFRVSYVHSGFLRAIFSGGAFFATVTHVIPDGA